MKWLKAKLKRAGVFLKNHKQEIILSLPFWVMDYMVRLIGHAIGFYPVFYPGPNLFTMLWVFLIIGLSSYGGKIFGRIFYGVFFLLFYILFLVQIIYYPFTKLYFSFNLLQMAGEGSDYILDTVLHAPLYSYIGAVLVLFLGIFLFWRHPWEKKANPGKIAGVCILYLALHLVLPFSLGFKNKEIKWDNFINARNIYDDFSDINKSLRVSGLYEYSVRNLYITFLKPEEKIDDSEEQFLEEAYREEKEENTNEYTGLFAGKNVIFLQLEGMDEWLLTEETTPNLYALRQQALDFTDHYSIYTGGGSTFNSEFAVNTGFTTPVSYAKNVYTLNESTFPNTLAKGFAGQGYTANAFHMNSGEFYNRRINYLNWGYDEYYGLVDLGEYEDEEYELDRELINNQTFYQAMFRNSDKFLDYIISYTPHTPFTTEKGIGKLVAERKYGKGNVPELSEEEVVKLEVAETDYMVGLLLEALRENDLYEKTVIIAFADHYLYTINDKSVLDKYKITKDNRINRTPFFIWSSDVEPRKIDKVTMQMDILPTSLNLFGIPYESSNYIGEDALAEDYEGTVFFSDYSWYDGKRYVDNGVVTDGEALSEKELKQKDEQIRKKIRKNDLSLKFDYFAR